MEIRLPEGKLVCTKELVASWRGRKSCRVRELKSLVGSLQHAYKVVLPGRTFMRRMQELLSRAKMGSDYLHLNKDFRTDVEWWHAFLSSWNGVSMLRRVRVDSLMRNSGGTYQVLGGVGHYVEACGCSCSGCQLAAFSSHFQVTSGQMTSVSGHFRSPEVV